MNLERLKKILEDETLSDQDKLLTIRREYIDEPRSPTRGEIKTSFVNDRIYKLLNDYPHVKAIEVITIDAIEVNGKALTSILPIQLTDLQPFGLSKLRVAIEVPGYGDLNIRLISDIHRGIIQVKVERPPNEELINQLTGNQLRHPSELEVCLRATMKVEGINGTVFK